ncbi:MAG: ATP-binding protein [bacterium]
MKDDLKSKEELLKELKSLKGRIAELENLGGQNTDAEVRNLKQQVEFILGATKTGLDIIDSSYNLCYIDPAWQKIYGPPAGKKCYQYFMGRQEICPTCAIPRALETKQPIVSEEILVKEGRRPIQVTTIPFQDANGEWLVAEVNVDISERKKAEEKLQTAYEEMENKVEERTKYLIDLNKNLANEIAARKKTDNMLSALKDCFLVFGSDPDRNIQLLVDICGEILEPTCAIYNRLEGDNLCSIGRWKTPPDFKSVDKADGHICTDIIKKGKDEPCIIHNLKDSRYAHSDPNVLRYNLDTYIGLAVKCKGEPVGSLCVVYHSEVNPDEDYLKFLNIVAKAIGVEEERRLAKSELKESEACYHSLVDLSPDAIAVHSEGKVVFVNVAAVKMFGAENAEQVIGRPTMSFVHPDSQKVVGQRIGSMLKKGDKAPLLEETFLRLDGTPIEVEVVAMPLMFRGKQSIQVVIRDISGRKKVERMKYNLIRDVSHKLKNPVAMAEMAYDMGKEGIKNRDMAQIEKSHQIVFSNIRKLRKDIDVILNFYALSRRKTLGKREPVYLNRIIKEVISELQEIISSKKLGLKVAVSKGVGKIVFVTNEMRILLYNLIDNAVKFTEHGTISVSADKLDKGIRIKVSDTGCGILPAEQEIVFDAFYQQHPTVPGTGLGLSICKEIVSRHNGSITISSKGVGRGTTVTIILPEGEGRGKR